MKKNRILLYITGIVLALIIILLILLNTIFYDYKSKMNSFLNSYYESSENDLTNVNNLIDRYKNNTNRTLTISEIIESDLKTRIENFNISYKDIDDLANSKEFLIGKINYFFDNISKTVQLINSKEIVNNQIENLFNSKEAYLIAKKYFDDNDYNNAYNFYVKVIENDSYYEDTTNKIDKIFNDEIKNIEDDIASFKNKITDGLSNEEKINIYKESLDYLMKKKKNTTFDISKSKSFNNIKNDLNDHLIKLYLEISNELSNNNKYDDAIKKLEEGINYLNNFELNTSELIDQKEKYNEMQPVSLTSIKGIVDGSSIKEELAIFDINNNNYARGISFIKNNNSTIIYELNKEYKYLSGTINIGKDVITKKKNYGRIRIYADNKSIYDSSDLTTTFKLKSIKLNISDINTLKIEYTISNNKSIDKSNISVAVFGNPMLEKY